VIDARNSVERRVLTDWMHATWGASDPKQKFETISLPLSDDSRALDLDALTQRLDRDARQLVIPLRVAWQIPGFDKGQGLRLRSLVFGDPRTPGYFRAQMNLLRDRKRAMCLMGEPATVAELRARFGQQVSSADWKGENEFAAFVARQAALTLDIQERGVRGSRYKVPRFVADSVRTSPKFRAAIENLAAEKGTQVGALYKEARTYFRELISRPSAMFLDMRARLERFMFTSGYDKQMDYDAREFEALRQTIRRYPTLILFTHKTYIDGAAPTYLLYNNDMPMVHTFGGINLDIPGPGTLYRRSGMIFIRRSFQDNPLYKLVLRHYIAYLLNKHFPMSWAFEGTRSRLGKLMPPKYGLLKYVVDAAHDIGIENLHIVPFVTSFDLIRDVEEYASEQTGRIKKPESIGWFFSYLNSLREPMGRIRVDLGGPIVVKNAPSPEDKTALNRIAFDISVHANKVTPLTVTSVLCLGLLGAAPRGGTSRELHVFIRFVADWAKARGIRMTAAIANSDEDAINRTIDTLVNGKVLTRYDQGSSTVYTIEPSKHPIASYYRNTIVHHFLDKAIIELSLYKAAEAPENRTGVFWAETDRLHDLFKFEFYYPPREEFRRNLKAEIERTAPHWQSKLEAGGNAFEALMRRFEPMMGHAALLPYVEAYSVVFDLLMRLKGGETLSQGDCVAAALKEGKQAQLLRRITSEASIGKILFQNGYQLAANLGVAGETTDAVSAKRKALVAEFRDLSRRMERMRVDMLSRSSQYLE
jgi:glycerol-3-phosphate O-acyltransferase